MGWRLSGCRREASARQLARRLRENPRASRKPRDPRPTDRTQPGTLHSTLPTCQDLSFADQGRGFHSLGAIVGLPPLRRWGLPSTRSAGKSVGVLARGLLPYETGSSPSSGPAAANGISTVFWQMCLPRDHVQPSHAKPRLHHVIRLPRGIKSRLYLQDVMRWSNINGQGKSIGDRKENGPVTCLGRR